MSREKKTYRQNLEELMAAFPGKRLISVSDAARYLGIDRRTVKKKYPAVSGTNYINIINLASWLSV